MARKPAFDMIEIPSGKHPDWQDIDNRAAFEEDIRIHLYEAMDNLKSAQLPDEEKIHWGRVLASLGSLARYFKSKGYSMHVH